MFQRFFLHATRDKSVVGRLKSVGNTMTVPKKKSSGKQGKYFSLNLKFLYVTRPWREISLLIDYCYYC